MNGNCPAMYWGIVIWMAIVQRCIGAFGRFRRQQSWWHHRCRNNPFMPTVQTFAVWETDVSRDKGGTSDAPLKPLRDDSALGALSSLRGLRGAPEVPSLCRETQSLGQQMLNVPLGINWLNRKHHRQIFDILTFWWVDIIADLFFNSSLN